MRDEPRRADDPERQSGWADKPTGRQVERKADVGPARKVQVNVEDDFAVDGGSEPVDEDTQQNAVSPTRRRASRAIQALVLLVALAAVILGAEVLSRWLHEPGLLVRLVAIAAGLLVVALLFEVAFGWMRLSS